VPGPRGSLPMMIDFTRQIFKTTSYLTYRLQTKKSDLNNKHVWTDQGVMRILSCPVGTLGSGMGWDGVRGWLAANGKQGLSPVNCKWAKMFSRSRATADVDI